MRFMWVTLSGLLLVGCTSQQPATMPASNTSEPLASAQVASSALVFNPPLAIDQPNIDLSRSDRGPAAFYGFEDPTVTFYSVGTDDRQTTDNTDRFRREAYIEQSGATRR